MNGATVLGGMILIANLAGCAAEVPQRGSVTSRGDGVVEAIARRDAPGSGHAASGAGVAGVASVLASGSLTTPSGAAAPVATGAKGGGVVAGAVASAIAAPPATPPGDRSAWRVSVRLDSGALKTIDQTDVSALSVGQRVRLQDDRVVPE